MNHFCTAMDRGYLVQGLAFWRSLAAHDPAATLWVLALDEFAADLLREMADPRLKKWKRAIPGSGWPRVIVPLWSIISR